MLEATLLGGGDGEGSATAAACSAADGDAAGEAESEFVSEAPFATAEGAVMGAAVPEPAELWLSAGLR
jgi:hypothetical protein